MKNTLGKIIFSFYAFWMPLFADAPLADYTLHTNKKTLHIKEPLLITFTVKQKNHTDNMFFLFQCKKSPDYEVHLLHKTVHDKEYHNSMATFEYVLFALKEKTLHVNFDFVIRTASDKAVKQSYVSDHDDSIAISINNTKVEVPPLTIKLKKLEKVVDLVGDFRLNSKIDTTEIDQYGAVNLHYTLLGTGYKEKYLKILNKEIKNVTIFSQIQDNLSKLTKEGYIINTKYIYALSAKEDFTIPPRTLKIYSPTKNRYYTLRTKAYNIKVNTIERSKLLDKTESPQTKNWINIQSIKNIFIYTIIFISGFLAAKFSTTTFAKKSKEDKFKDIKNAATAKELLMTLILHYQDKGINEEISKLENTLNTNHSIQLGKFKKEIISKLM